MALLGNLTGSSQFFSDELFYNDVATQSLRFDDGSSAFLHRTPSGAGNQKTWTFSAWIKPSNVTISRSIFARHDSGSNTFLFRLDQNDDLQVENYTSSAYQLHLVTDAKFRDISAWYHVVLSLDTTQGTAANRAKLYVNGVQKTSFSSSTYPSQNADLKVNAAAVHRIGARAPDNYFDGYMAEVNFVDGLALDPTYFGETKNGVWIAKKYTGSYGTNGFRLQFNQTGVGTASTTTIGADTSGNTNHFTSSGIVASDCAMPDSPENNFATLNPLSFLTDNQLENGNLELDHEATSHRANTGTMFMQTGKWYFEVHNKTSGAGSTIAFGAGLQDITKLLSYASGANNYVYYVNNNSARFLANESSTTLSTDGTHTVGAGGIIQVAYDADTGKIFIGLNNTYIAEDGGTDGNPATGANPTKTLSTSVDYIPFVGVYNNIAIANFGQDSSFAGNKTAQGNTDGNGIGDFYYAPPSGYLALCTANLPEPTIGPNSGTNEQADDYFNTVLWTGNGQSGQAITGVGFKPDWVWIKERNSTSSNALYDSSRGIKKQLESNTTDAETNYDSNLLSFDTDGFTLGGSGATNQNNNTFVGWNWKANGGTTSTNDASATSVGDTDSVIQANTDAGFSIVTYTGFSGSSGTATVAHGLSQAPEIIIHKSRTRTSAWWVQAPNVLSTASHFLDFSTATPFELSSYGTMSAPTSSVFSINGVDGVGGESANYVAYCFHSVEGYSKIGGSYTGNGSTDGTFVFTGFRPAFIMSKKTSGTGNWEMFDTTRDPINYSGKYILANSSDAEGDTGTNTAGHIFDILSNGFKLRNTNSDRNSSGGTYIYMAFAEAPFKYANAR